MVSASRAARNRRTVANVIALGQGGGGVVAARTAVIQDIVNAAAAASGNNPVVLPDMATPPTMTLSSTHDAALTSRFNVVDNPALFLLSPAKEYYRTSNKRRIAGATTFTPGTGSIRTSFSSAGLVSPEPNTGDSTTCSDVTFDTPVTDTVEIEVQPANATSPYRIIVDGQYAARDGVIIDSTAKSFVKLVFATAAKRTITIEFQSAVATLGLVSFGPGLTMTLPNINPIKVVSTGDSYTEALNIGSLTNFFMFDGWSSVFTKRLLGARGRLRNAAVGGTGYWNQSNGRRPADGYGGANAGANRSDIGQQMAYWVNDGHLYHMMLYAGGFNDAGQTSDANIRALARADWELARAQQPQALIVIFGIWGGNAITTDAASRITTEAALKAEFEAWNDPFSIFIPVSPPQGFSQQTAWLYGNGDEATAATVPGNAATYICNDHTHPNRAGHLYLGGRADTTFRAQLPALAARYGVAA